MRNKNVVITGAAGGVGSLLALGLAKKGASVICLGRTEDKLVKMVSEIKNQTASLGGNASYVVVDMMDENAVHSAGKKIEEEQGSIDVWINNVGVNNHNAIGATWEIEPKNWWTEVSSNLYTAFLGTRTAINLMRKRNYGYIINLGGGGVQKPKPFGSAYGAAKTAIVKFTETVNIELETEKLNIKVFAFNPGFIRNERTEVLVESDVAHRYMPELKQILKHGKMSDPQDSVDLIEILVSGKANDLGGHYFFSDDKNMDVIIENSENVIRQEQNLLRVKV